MIIPGPSKQVLVQFIHSLSRCVEFIGLKRMENLVIVASHRRNAFQDICHQTKVTGELC